MEKECSSVYNVVCFTFCLFAQGNFTYADDLRGDEDQALLRLDVQEDASLVVCD